MSLRKPDSTDHSVTHPSIRDDRDADSDRDVVMDEVDAELARRRSKGTFQLDAEIEADRHIGQPSAFLGPYRHAASSQLCPGPSTPGRPVERIAAVE